VSFGGIKVTVADSAFSKCVRERSGWACEFCSREFPEGHRAGLHCSHYFGRRNASTRHEPLNGFSLCFRCHLHLGANPHEHSEWVRGMLGPIAYNVLCEKRQQILRKNERPTDKELAAHFRSELKRMEALRAQGETGRIEFVGY
jgi:hypothetical protein